MSGHVVENAGNLMSGFSLCKDSFGETSASGPSMIDIGKGLEQLIVVLDTVVDTTCGKQGRDELMRLAWMDRLVIDPLKHFRKRPFQPLGQ